DCRKKLVNVIDQFSRESPSSRVTHHGEKTFASTRIVKPLDVRPQSVLRNADTDLLRRYLLDRVCFIKNDEIIWEQEPGLTFFLHVRRSQQNEQQRVIEHDHVRCQKTFAGLLIETARILATSLLSADMRLAANLRPNF